MSEKQTLPDLNGILPARNIRIVKHGLASRWFYLFLSVIFAFASVAIAVAWSPDLYKDYQIKNDPVVLEDASVFDGNCRTKKMITDCKATVTYTYEGENKVKPVEFSFMSLSRGDYETDVVMQKSNPENVTLSLAIDEFWNRVAVAGVLFALMLGLCLLFFMRFVQISRTASAIRVADELKLCWARIMSRKDSFGSAKIGYNPLESRSKKRTVIAAFGKKETPFLHYDEKSDETYGVAAIHPKAILPVLLDDGFERLDLTPEERAAMQQALTGRLPA